MKKKQGFVDRYFSMFKNAREILSLFSNQYEVIPAVTDELQAIAYKLRYKIYTQEFGFEPENKHQLERDAYDAHSTQILLYFKPLKQYIGCARFVHGQMDDCYHALPLEKMTTEKTVLEAIETGRLLGQNIAEISRLAIDRDFRRLNRVGHATAKTAPTLRSSCALLALLLGIQAYAKTKDIKLMYGVVEKKLWNSFSKLNLPVKIIGEPVECAGKRYPIMLNRDEVENMIPIYIRPTFHNIERKIKETLDQHNDQENDFLINTDLVANIVANAPETIRING